MVQGIYSYLRNAASLCNELATQLHDEVAEIEQQKYVLAVVFFVTYTYDDEEEEFTPIAITEKTFFKYIYANGENTNWDARLSGLAILFRYIYH